MIAAGPNERLRYTLYPQQNDDEGAEPAGTRGAIRATQPQEGMVALVYTLAPNYILEH